MLCDTKEFIFNPTTGEFDLVNKNYQRYEIQAGETYTIDNRISSVISGPFENAGLLELKGRLELI